ncbi:MAG: hypothetical protein ACE5QF_04200 [Thermoplasmata archaeon]
MGALVEARNAHKTCDRAPKRASLEMRGGGMAPIVGFPGRGKTTRLNSSSGLDDVTGGEVLMDGTSPSGKAFKSAGPVLRRRVP